METTTTEKEHVAWAKERALEILAEGDVRGAFISMMSDLRKHPRTQDHPMLKLGPQLLEGHHLDTSIAMRKFIEGF